MKNLRYAIGSIMLLAILLVSCKKEAIKDTTIESIESKAAVGVYVTYTIPKGAHYSNNSFFKSVKFSEMKFAVTFDSSAVYSTSNPINQSDINKLYGISEGVNNQQNSARIGWNWYTNKLILYAYVYKNGVRTFKKITQVSIGAENICSIKVSGSSYIFTVNGISVTLERSGNSATASGYQQYPYFGGNEVAPHTISIRIKNL